MTDASVQRSVVITNSAGLHARPAAALVEMMKGFSASVTVEVGAKRADARSIMSVLALGAGTGDKATITAVGDDAAEAVSQIEALLTSEDGT